MTQQLNCHHHKQFTSQRMKTLRVWAASSCPPAGMLQMWVRTKICLLSLLFYSTTDILGGFAGGTICKDPACQCRWCKRPGSLGSIPGLGNPLEEELAPHSSILAWKIPWIEELSMESQRVRPDWAAELNGTELNYEFLTYSCSYLEPVCGSMSSSNCCFLTCITGFSRGRSGGLLSHLFQNFPQFIVIHTVEGFRIVNKEK